MTPNCQTKTPFAVRQGHQKYMFEWQKVRIREECGCLREANPKAQRNELPAVKLLLEKHK